MVLGVPGQGFVTVNLSGCVLQATTYNFEVACLRVLRGIVAPSGALMCASIAVLLKQIAHSDLFVDLASFLSRHNENFIV